MISALVKELSNWNNGQSTIDEKNLISLRKILGDVLKELNEVSSIFKKATRNPSPDNALAAKNILEALKTGQFEELHKLLPQVENKLGNVSSYYSDIVLVIKNLIHTIEKSTFNQQQIAQLNQLAVYDPRYVPDFPEETNKEGLDQHLKASIYNTQDEADKTLKVIREVLQNAVDATDPKKHPELSNRPNFLPTIKITTSKHDKLLDLIVEDSGTGMNWDILSKKFFVTFESGKKDDPHSTGGFGIAKTLIQETPAHGWSIDTNDIHSNKFQKNVYFGTKMGEGYVHPTSKIKKQSNGGTTISLFGLPYVSNYTIRDYCEKYATNGRVKIILNNEQITPQFELNTSLVKPLSNINSLIDVYGDSQSTKDIAKNVLGSLKNDIEEKMAEVNDFQTAQTSVQFYVRKIEYTGNLFVMVNGQFQFEEPKWFNKIQLICDIQTTAKAGTEEYPLDPGRSKIKGKLGEAVEKVCQQIKSFAEKVGNDSLFKQGIESFTVNRDQKPMTSHGEKEVDDKAVEAIYNSLSSGFEKSPSEIEKDIINAVEKQTGKIYNDSERKVADAVLKDVLSNKGKDETITQNDIRKIIDGLSTPANILIQKNFVARDWINQNMDLTAEVLILWQKTLKIIVDKLTSTKFGRIISQKEFVPGLIYSDEAHGLFVPADEQKGRPYPSVSVNPITAASAINPALFSEKLITKTGKEAFKVAEQEAEQSLTADTPTNRLSKLLYHIAVHELTHLMFPEAWEGNYDQFHNNVTYLEYIAHDCYIQIKDEVKKTMADLRKNSNKLINAIAKHSRNKNENKIFRENKKLVSTKNNLSFSNWFYRSE